MIPIRTMDVEGRVLFRRTNGQFRPRPHTPPYATQEERAMTAARRGKPLTGTMMLRPALRLPAPTSDAQGRFEDEVYEMCLLFRGAAARYMERCPVGGTTDSLVLQDLINNPRCGEDFPIARGDYVLVVDNADPETNRPRQIKMAYKPSFLDRLPLLNDEWEEVLDHAGNNGEDGDARVDNEAADEGEDRRVVEG